MNYNNLRSLELLTIEIEQSQINIAPTYEQWMRFSFAIAYCCKEEGRELYHRICKALSPVQREGYGSSLRQRPQEE